MATTLNYPALDTAHQTAPPTLPVVRRHPIIVASNRGPIEHRLTAEGRLMTTVASGGVVTALNALAHHIDFTWIASAVGAGDRRAATQPVAATTANPRLRFVLLSPEVYDRHYNAFSNPLLWFLQHSLWPRLSPRAIDAGLNSGWAAGYVPANHAFAQTVAAEARRLGGLPVVMLQDYHLYLTAGYLRPLLAGALLQHFVHIPWPAPAAWQVLPTVIRQTIFRGLLANDIIGFQTARCARHFLDGCATFLPEAHVDYASTCVTLAGHRTWLRSYPISIDVAAVRSLLASPQVAAHHRRLGALQGERTIVRVDRLDPSKDVLNGFHAFERLLQEHRQWIGRVKFLAFLVPSRANIAEYRRYAEETFALVAAINARYGHAGYRPIEVFHENNRPQALAGLQLYDVLLVNPIADGMNLVAKEGPIANERDGVLVLSEGAGAHEQLHSGALSVAPGDIPAIAGALAKALTMPAPERGRRAALLRRLVVQADLRTWLHRQLDDLGQLSAALDLAAAQ